MTAAPLFVPVSLPSVVFVLDGETCGGTVLVRRPSRGELDALEAGAGRDDLAGVMGLAYGLAGLDIRRVLMLSPEARVILDDAIVERIAEARELHLT